MSKKNIKSQGLNNKNLKGLMKEFFEEADRSLARTKEDFKKRNQNFNMRSYSRNATFFYDHKLADIEKCLASKIEVALGPLFGHPKEIEKILWVAAAKGCSPKHQTNFDTVINECFTELEGLRSSSFRFVQPAYNVVLAEDISEIGIGPVRIVTGQVLTGELTNQFSTYNLQFTSNDDKPSGFEFSGDRGYNAAPTMWDMQIESSAAARIEHAEWLTCIATTLIRLIVPQQNMHALYPARKDVENKPFDVHKSSYEYITIDMNEQMTTGGGAAGRYYELGQAAADDLRNCDTQKKVALVFEPPEKSLAKRFAQGAGWLGKGRQALDRSERFFFFFTALEALLSRDDKSVPITQTIAKHAAVLWTDDIHERIAKTKQILDLYQNRSRLVHAGSRSITFGDSNALHDIAEKIFDIVWNTVDLNTPHKDFFKRLADASYGLPYEENS